MALFSGTYRVPTRCHVTVFVTITWVCTSGVFYSISPFQLLAVCKARGLGSTFPLLGEIYVAELEKPVYGADHYHTPCPFDI
jgi:hypothetical protein